MANPNAFVSHYVRPVQPTGERLAARQTREFELDGGRRVRLDPGNARSEGFARVLTGLAELRHPVYLELDPATDGISRLLVPTTGRVDRVREVDRGIEVLLERSHARHLLSREDADFAEHERVLREAVVRKARVILTADDLFRVVDLRFFEPGPDDGPVRRLPPVSESWIDRVRHWRFWPWRWPFYRCVSFQRAQQIFDAMSATTCSPATVPPPCIPFLYPDNGCWARAHEMARLMIGLGHIPRKVWISGILHTPTPNNPACFVSWGWHVAPTLCVRRRRWLWWAGIRMVIDPSMFATPVTVADWKEAQGDPGATLNHTDWSDYLFGQTDPDFTDTNHDLGVYRMALQARSIGPDGPPPYANCA
jgi:hypothetical protein